MEKSKEKETGSIGYKVNYLVKVTFPKYGETREIDVYLSLNTTNHFIYEPLCLVERKLNPSTQQWDPVIEIQKNCAGDHLLYLNVLVDDPIAMKKIIREALAKQDLKFIVFNENIGLAKIAKINLEFEGLPPEIAVDKTSFKYDDRMHSFKVGFIIKKLEDREKFVAYLSNYCMKGIAKFFVSEEEGVSTKEIRESISSRNIADCAFITKLAGGAGEVYVCREDVNKFVSAVVSDISINRYAEFEPEDGKNVLVNDAAISQILKIATKVDITSMDESLRNKILAQTFDSHDIATDMVHKESSHKKDEDHSSSSDTKDIDVHGALFNVVNFGVKVDLKSLKDKEEKHAEDHEFEGAKHKAKSLDILKINLAELRKVDTIGYCHIKGRPHCIINEKSFLPLIKSSSCPKEPNEVVR